MLPHRKTGGCKKIRGDLYVFSVKSMFSHENNNSLFLIISNILKLVYIITKKKESFIFIFDILYK